jgi:hypothetical protein
MFSRLRPKVPGSISAHKLVTRGSGRRELLSSKPAKRGILSKRGAIVILGDRQVYVVAVALFLLAMGGAWGQSTSEWDLEGTLGQRRIGMTILVSGSNTIAGSHYFYAKYLQDIPLTGAIQGSTITLKEPAGGNFVLHFVGNGSEGNKPLDFSNSVGLSGTWAKGTTILPVKLEMGGVSPTPANGRRYESVTDESNAAFEAKVRGFLTAVLSGDRTAAARFVSFPLRVNQAGKSHMIRSEKQLAAEWDRVFTPASLAEFKNAIPHDMWVRNGQVMLGNGIAWFGAKGAESINVP